ncbi:MAG TPA: hypothetical protein VJ251_01695 [Stellaceae bacterium]|nr:hypothetical protein [Stellaceae bacterium]
MIAVIGAHDSRDIQRVVPFGLRQGDTVYLCDQHMILMKMEYDERPRLAFARPAGRSREAARKPGDNAATALKSVVVDPSTYGWAGDTPLGRLFAKTIIYE